jgi:D-alanine-D-alanine ligase
MPGSVAFYLWEPCGISFRNMISKLIDYALKMHKEHDKNIYSFDTALLHKASSGGIKGGKSAK